MADLNRRLPQNVLGQFYVDDTCIYCDLCVEIAPTIFKEINEQGWAAVFNEPSTEAEIALAIAALEACPTESIGRDGEMSGPENASIESDKECSPEETFNRLYRAIKRARLGDIQAFLAYGGSANLGNRNGWSLLMASAKYGQSAIATELLDAGTDVDAANRTGETALALAEGCGQVKMVRLLLARGARTDIRPLGRSLTGYIQITSRSKAATEALANSIPDISRLPFENPG